MNNLRFQNKRPFLTRVLVGGGITYEITKWFVLAIVLIGLITTFWMSIFVVDGESMEPNLHNHEIVLYNKSTYRAHNPKRGDVVVVRYPGDPEDKRYVKRVVGLPGETITITDGKVYLNHNLYKELYLSPTLYTEPSGEWVLKSGEYFICGDNRPNSNDSRYFGPVEKRFVQGKAVRIIFPRFLPILDY